MATKVLIVEDDSNIAQLLQLYLEKEGFETRIAPDGGKGVEEFRAWEPGLVLLDIMLPVMDGWAVCRKIRETSKTPIIMMTAKGQTEDKVNGLEMGAVDYIAKPFRARELLSRMRGALRRTKNVEEVLTIGSLVLDPSSAYVRKAGQEITLSALEYKLLLYLFQNKDRLITRENLRDAIWDSAGEYVSDNAINVYMRRLREKIEDDPAQPRIIVTVRGLGYKVGD